MSKHKPRRLLAERLALAAASYQESAVIPHCSKCLAPCCRLDPLVLELDWEHVKAFWRLDETRAAFDRRLSAGKGPAEIRPMNGAYYAHGKACPAYDEAHRRCRVYDQSLKPGGCTDFPIYEDQGSIVADLRCEAVDPKALAGWIARLVGKGYRVVQSADEEFPFMLTYTVQRTGARRAPARSGDSS
jgi:hypothetical protein